MIKTLRDRVEYEISLAIRDEDAIVNAPCVVLATIDERLRDDVLEELQTEIDALVTKFTDKLIERAKLTHENVNFKLEADGEKLEDYFS